MSRNYKKTNRGAARARKQRNRLIAGVGILAILAATVLVLAGGLFRTSDQVATSEAAQRQGRVLGSPAAPVTITAWEDFQCPICKAANSTTLKQVIADYVNTGKVQLQYRYFSFLGNESVKAAQAAEAAAEQGKFWEYHDALFAAQSGENRGAFSDARLKSIAQQIGLDMTQFNASFDSGKYAGVVQDELAEGKRLGVQGTPTFFVNGKAVGDWRNYDAFRSVIDSQLLAAGR